MEQERLHVFECFAHSTEHVLKSACTFPTQRKATVPKNATEQLGFDIAGFIGVAGPKLNGSVALCFPKPVLLKVLSKMLMQDFDEIKPEHDDATHELLEMIFGYTRQAFEDDKYAIRMTEPMVFHGYQLYSNYAQSHTVHLLPFHTDAGEFHLEFLLHPRPEGEATANEHGGDSATKTSEAAFFKPFVNATVKALSVQFGLAAKTGKPFFKKDARDCSFDIAGLVRIASNTLNGSFMLTFKRGVFLKLASKILGESPSDFSPGAEDLVCEIVNIIFGVAKASLNEQGHGVRMAFPTMFRGETIFSSCKRMRPSVVIPVECEIGEFCIELAIDG